MINAICDKGKLAPWKTQQFGGLDATNLGAGTQLRFITRGDVPRNADRDDGKADEEANSNRRIVASKGDQGLTEHDTGPQHITSSGLFEIDLVIILPCYFSQPEQIVEEIITP